MDRVEGLLLTVQEGHAVDRTQQGWLTFQMLTTWQEVECMKKWRLKRLAEGRARWSQNHQTCQTVEHSKEKNTELTVGLSRTCPLTENPATWNDSYITNIITCWRDKLHCKHVTKALKRSLAVANPVIWNSLPAALWTATLSPLTFARHLKAHLFGWSIERLRIIYDALYKSTHQHHRHQKDHDVHTVL